MSTTRSPRNKTLTLSPQEEKDFFSHCLTTLPQIVQQADIIDKTICADTFTTLEKLPQAWVDLAIVDPPYNLTKNYSGNTFTKQKPQEYHTYTQQWLSLLLPLLKPNASCYICCDWQSSIIIADVLTHFASQNALLIQNRITWEREKGRGAKHNWKNASEDIWFITKSSDYTFNLDAVKIRRKVIAPYTINGTPKDWQKTSEGSFRDTCPPNFWDDISIPYWSMSENTDHPTQKPEKLLAKLILASSNPGNIVFDPFVGSGSTSVTAKKLKRHWCAIEQNPQYCAWTEARLARADKDTTIQGFDGTVFYERNSGPIKR
ncbi:MAG: site-specific DNA-methyltransferase [Treponema sp.]|nr:site-specific DNA-methyltransferase [Treponema sp.]